MDTPTELEIQMHATKIFPDHTILQGSFIQGVWHTIYNHKTLTKSNDR